MASTNKRRPEWDRILSAAQKNDAALIHRLVEEAGVDPNHTNAVGQSALHVASLWGNVAAVRALLALSANVNAQNQISGATPLHSAVQSSKKPSSNRILCAKLLIVEGQADPDQKDNFGGKPIDYLNQETETGGAEGEDELYRSNMREVLTNTLVPEPEVFRIVREGDVAGLISYLDGVGKTDGWGLEARDRSGLTPLLYAATEIKTISQRRQDLDDSAKKSDTPPPTEEEDSVRTSKMVNIISVLLERGSKPDVVLQRGASSPSADKDDIDLSKTPLHAICAEIYSIGTTNDSPPSATALLPHLKSAAKSLSQHKATLAPATINYLHDASRRGYLPIIQFWVEELGVSPNLVGRQGMTPLHFAARSGRLEVCQYLLDKGADKGSVDVRGKTALDFAVVNRKEEVVAFLGEGKD